MGIQYCVQRRCYIINGLYPNIIVTHHVTTHVGCAGHGISYLLNSTATSNSRASSTLCLQFRPLKTKLQVFYSEDASCLPPCRFNDCMHLASRLSWPLTSCNATVEVRAMSVAHWRRHLIQQLKQLNEHLQCCPERLPKRTVKNEIPVPAASHN